MKSFSQYLVLSAALLVLSDVEAITLSVSGGTWTQVVSGVGLQAGDNLTSVYESGTAQASLTVDQTTNNWTIYVRHNNSDWHSGVSLEVRRTSDGTGSGGLPSGGDTYQDILTSDTSFFSGSGNRAGINLQFRLRGISVDQGIKDYSTDITYTVEEN